MTQYKKIFFKKTSQVEIRLFTLNILNSENKINKFLTILDIFELGKINFIGSFYVFNSDNITEELFRIDKNIVLMNENKKKDYPFEINIQFNGEIIDKIIRFISEINTSLYIIPANSETQIPQIEILANDREFSFIIFRKDIYDLDNVILKIRDILN
jgi:hypothetical protein